MKYAVIKTGNKQYKVSEGEIIEIDRININPQDSYTFSDILLFSDGTDTKVGTPFIPNAKVTAGILEHKKGKKIRVAKFKAKSRYRRVKGFKPSITKVKIEKISLV